MTTRRHHSQKGGRYQVSVMSSRQARVYWMLVGVWLATLIWFWQWWLQRGHVVSVVGLLLTSYVAAYETIIPFWFFWFAGHAKKPNTALPLPRGRVAMMTTKVPSEPNEMLYRTLTAMLRQQYPGPFDVWLAAEETRRENPQLYEWCARHGVHVTCRKGIPEFNRSSYPGQAKTKEGNTLSWYVIVGYDRYDFVVQMDADHAPTRRDYLRCMIAPFVDPSVGLVAAPSMNDANREESWAVRGRVFVETNVHGLMQAGYSSWHTAMGIGSHYAVRTEALRKAGGPGPTRAEDAGTTLLINAAGYNSVFSIDAEAHGDGPGSFGVAVTQELDWSISLVRLLLEWLPRKWRHLTWRKRIIFTFALGWYPLYASHMFVGILLPVVALLTNTPWVNMHFTDFLWRWWVFVVACILPVWFIRSQGWFRPANAPVISWEAIVFQAVRWPWAVIGCVGGAISTVFRAGYTFHITPKGKGAEHPLGVQTVWPYLLIIFISGAAIMLVRQARNAEGYRGLALLDIAIYTLVLAIVVSRHFIESKDLRSRLSGVPGVVGNVVSMAVVASAALVTLPKITPMFSLSAAPPAADAGFQYSGVRPQLGPTPVPTSAPVDLLVELPTLIPVFPTPTAVPVVDLPTDHLLTGMHDPGGTFSEMKFDIRHSFVDWNKADQIDDAIEAAQEAGEFPMVSVQPFPAADRSPDALLQDISAGAYDAQIRAMAQILKGHSPQQVIVRVGHEMDLCQVYAWAKCSPALFIPAYRHVVDMNRGLGVTNALWMWSPAGGNPDTDKFYPGDSYVDMIGITGLESEDWARYYGYEPQPRYFVQLLKERYGLAPQFQKPLLIAELGISYSDPMVDREPWLTSAFEVMNDRVNYPLLAGWVYFNAITQANPHINILPDFRISYAELQSAMTAAEEGQ